MNNFNYTKPHARKNGDTTQQPQPLVSPNTPVNDPGTITDVVFSNHTEDQILDLIESGLLTARQCFRLGQRYQQHCERQAWLSGLSFTGGEQ